ncbi:unnamed protein product [Acanthoscelides obtectus]|nr:unnamed protein product [Acanthoscelides obtectus]CAK1662682.1 hypothetical protein AOBTE_LOCUS23262 [Acanthoscelides obtectus]
MDEARQTYALCQDLHPRTTSQENELDKEVNSLTKRETDFAQAQNEDRKLLKSLEQDYADLCQKEEKSKQILENEAMISERQKESELLVNIKTIESELKDSETEDRTLQWTVAQSLSKYEELESRLSAKKGNNNDIHVAIESIQESCTADEGSIEKLESEITGWEEKLISIQGEIHSLEECTLSEEPQEDLEELLKEKLQSLREIKATKCEKKLKYKEMLESSQSKINLEELQCTDLQKTVTEFKEKLEKTENSLAELNAEVGKLVSENNLSLTALEKYELSVKYEKQKLKNTMKIESRNIFTRPSTPVKNSHTPSRELNSVTSTSKKSSDNWDSDGSLEADFNAFKQRRKRLRKDNV